MWLYPTLMQVVVSLAIEVPVYIGFLLVALWFFCRAAMETVLLCLEMCGEVCTELELIFGGME